jgi:UDP-N-acetylglucosamine 1-carboxyvinyltransferase
MRTKTALGQMVEEGRFRGGSAPYGYRLEKSGILNKRKHEVYMLVIDEDEARVVRMMFDLCISSGYGRWRLANFLNSMGADIRGAGTDSIRIQGVERLHGGTYSVIPDQIEAGTYMAACAAAGGEVRLANVIPRHLECISAKLREMGVTVVEGGDSVLVRSNGRLRHTNVKTQPYPGFPTDMQPQISVALCLADGTSVVTEGVYDNRYRYIQELGRMGADAQVDGCTAIINGVEGLHGAEVRACDLRAGAAVVIAGLCATGETVVTDIRFIERGYENFVGKLRGVGADIVLERDGAEQCAAAAAE